MVDGIGDLLKVVSFIFVRDFRMHIFHARFFAVLLGVMATASAAQDAQTVPDGACIVASGWCWPLYPDPSGSACECRTPTGTEYGYIK